MVGHYCLDSFAVDNTVNEARENALNSVGNLGSIKYSELASYFNYERNTFRPH
jgi:hypothetical protein